MPSRRPWFFSCDGLDGGNEAPLLHPVIEVPWRDPLRRGERQVPLQLRGRLQNTHVYLEARLLANILVGRQTSAATDHLHKPVRLVEIIEGGRKIRNLRNLKLQRREEVLKFSPTLAEDLDKFPPKV